METIFVQIASYRDGELIHTINDCLKKAKYPERLRFGICWQREDIDTSLEPFFNDARFKIIDVPYKKSEGVCWARWNTNSLWVGEDYSFQIDSHTRFVAGWDELIVNMWKSLNDEFAVITGYPPAYQPNDGEIKWGSIPKSSNVIGFTTDEIIHTVPSLILTPHRPTRGLHIVGGFLFSHGLINLKVQYDPFLYFKGEEQSMTLRLFTHGYNIYNSNKVIIYHFYNRKGGNRHWDDHKNWIKRHQNSINRIKNLIGNVKNINLGKWGLGNVRTLKDWKQYSGIDYKKKMVHINTYNAIEPPINGKRNGWLNKKIKYSVNCIWNNDIIAKDNIKLYTFIIFDIHYREIYREDINTENDTSILNGEINKKTFTFTLNQSFGSEPKYFFIWPYSNDNEWIGDRPDFMEIESSYEIS